MNSKIINYACFVFIADFQSCACSKVVGGMQAGHALDAVIILHITKVVCLGLGGP